MINTVQLDYNSVARTAVDTEQNNLGTIDTTRIEKDLNESIRWRETDEKMIEESRRERNCKRGKQERNWREKGRKRENSSAKRMKKSALFGEENFSFQNFYLLYQCIKKRSFSIDWGVDMNKWWVVEIHFDPIQWWLEGLNWWGKEWF